MELSGTQRRGGLPSLQMATELEATPIKNSCTNPEDETGTSRVAVTEKGKGKGTEKGRKRENLSSR